MQVWNQKKQGGQHKLKQHHQVNENVKTPMHSIHHNVITSWMFIRVPITIRNRDYDFKSHVMTAMPKEVANEITIKKPPTSNTLIPDPI